MICILAWFSCQTSQHSSLTLTYWFADILNVQQKWKFSTSIFSPQGIVTGMMKCMHTHQTFVNCNHPIILKRSYLINLSWVKKNCYIPCLLVKAFLWKIRKQDEDQHQLTVNSLCFLQVLTIVCFDIQTLQWCSTVEVCRIWSESIYLILLENQLILYFLYVHSTI